MSAPKARSPAPPARSCVGAALPARLSVRGEKLTRAVRLPFLDDQQAARAGVAGRVRVARQDRPRDFYRPLRRQAGRRRVERVAQIRAEISGDDPPGSCPCISLDHEREREVKAARRAVDAVADLIEDDPTALTAAGAATGLCGDQEGASALIERALALDPNNAWAWARWGMGRHLPR
jgi:hypothetical protein